MLISSRWNVLSSRYSSRLSYTFSPQFKKANLELSNDRFYLPDSNVCLQNEVFELVYDLNSVFDALSSLTPNVSYIKKFGKRFLILFNSLHKLRKADVLEKLIDYFWEQLQTGYIIKNKNVLKSYILREGPGVESPKMVAICIPKTIIEEKIPLLRESFHYLMTFFRYFNVDSN